MPFHWYLKNRSRFYSLRLHNVFSVYHYASSLMFLNFSAFPFSMLLFLNNLLIRCPWCDIPPFPCFTTGTQLIIISQHATHCPSLHHLSPEQRMKGELSGLSSSFFPLFSLFCPPYGDATTYSSDTSGFLHTHDQKDAVKTHLGTFCSFFSVMLTVGFLCVWEPI